MNECQGRLILASIHHGTEAIVRRCSVKKVFLDTCARVFFWIKLQACNFIKKETLAQEFYYKFWEISKNTFFYRTPQVAASMGWLLASIIYRSIHRRCSVKKVFLKISRNSQTSVLESFFNNVVDREAYNVLKQWLQRKCYLQILQEFQEISICRTSANDY